MALGIVSGAGVRMYASGAWWRPTGSGLVCGCAEQLPVEGWRRSISRFVSLILCRLACQSHEVPATMFGFFCSSVGLQWQSRVCVGNAGPRLLSGHALFT